MAVFVGLCVIASQPVSAENTRAKSSQSIDAAAKGITAQIEDDLANFGDQMLQSIQTKNCISVIAAKPVRRKNKSDGALTAPMEAQPAAVEAQPTPVEGASPQPAAVERESPRAADPYRAGSPKQPPNSWAINWARAETARMEYNFLFIEAPGVRIAIVGDGNKPKQIARLTRLATAMQAKMKVCGGG